MSRSQTPSSVAARLRCIRRVTVPAGGPVVTSRSEGASHMLARPSMKTVSLAALAAFVLLILFSNCGPAPKAADCKATGCASTEVCNVNTGLCVKTGTGGGSGGSGGGSSGVGGGSSSACGPGNCTGCCKNGSCMDPGHAVLPRRSGGATFDPCTGHEGRRLRAPRPGRTLGAGNRNGQNLRGPP